MDNLFPFVTTSEVALVVKVIILILIGLYTIFVFIVHNHIRSLHKIVEINHTTGSPLIQTLSFLYLGSAISLFIAAVVIL